jgi:hypothetical protein
MRKLLCGLAVASSALWSAGAAHAQRNALTEEEIAQGWILLFDGKTTAGWNIEGDAEVVDSVLVLGGTRATRAGPAVPIGRTFELRLEYRTDPGTWVPAKPGWLPPISFRMDTSSWLSESSVSRGLDRFSKDQKEWIEIIYTGDDKKVSSRFRALGGAAFVSQEQGGNTEQGTTSISFEMPAGPKLHLRNVKLKTEPVQTPLIYHAAAVLGILLIAVVAFVVIRARRGKLHGGGQQVTGG